MCKADFKVHTVNLRKEVKRLKKGGNVNDSEMGSLLSMEEEFLQEEEAGNRDEDQLLDVSMKPDKKMDAALKEKFKNMKKAAGAGGRTASIADFGKSMYGDADDDETGFKAADKEENDDMEFGGQSQFMME